METKICSKCNEIKPIDAFQIRTDYTDGRRRGQCRPCRNGYFKNYNDTSPKRAEYRENNIEKLAESNKKWREENKEYNRVRWAKYQADNKDKLAEKDHNWYMNNKERKLTNSRLWVKKNEEHVKSRKRSWRLNNLDKGREYNARRRFIKKSLEVEKVDYNLIRERDDTCYLCFVPFTNKERWNGKLTHVDHKIPLNRTELNPTHSYENCALTHAACNLSKNDKTPEEYWEFTTLNESR